MQTAYIRKASLPSAGSGLGVASENLIGQRAASLDATGDTGLVGGVCAEAADVGGSAGAGSAGKAGLLVEG